MQGLDVGSRWRRRRWRWRRRKRCKDAPKIPDRLFHDVDVDVDVKVWVGASSALAVRNFAGEVPRRKEGMAAGARIGSAST